MALVKPKQIKIHSTEGLRIFRSMNALEKYVETRDNKLQVTDFQRKDVCKIFHSDGSVFYMTNPYMEKVRFKRGAIDEIVFVVFSEHHKPLMYMYSDLLEIKYYPRELLPE